MDRFWTRDGFFYLCVLVVVAALVLGGGTRSGFLSDAVLQLLAVPLLLASLWRMAALPSGSAPRWALAFCAAIVLVPLLQLIPLPPAIWTSLPGREAEIEALELAGHGLPWMPVSVAPQATVLSALSLLVPLSVFLATVLLDFRERRLLSLVVLVFGLLSVFLGLSQVAQGQSSALRFFDFTNTMDATGFFANRNHFAALLYSVTLIAAAWAIDAALAPGAGGPRRKYATSAVIALVASFTVLVVLVAAQLMARSRAGLALTIVALLGALALAVADRRKGAGLSPARVLGASVLLAVMFATQFALYRVMERFAVDPLQDSRIPFALTTIEAAKSFMPFGSGMGTFVPVYAMFEKPQDVMVNVYVNRAHNDVIELWLEAGVAGLILMACFVVWLILRASTLWRRGPVGTHEVDGSLARAATVVVALLVAHSFVDYPLRTGAMTAVFAFACALLLPPPAPARKAAGDAAAPPAPSPAWSPQAGEPALRVPRAVERWPSQRWGRDIEWPEAWRPKREPKE